MQLNKKILIFGSVSIITLSSFAFYYAFGDSEKGTTTSNDSKNATSAESLPKPVKPAFDPEDKIPYQPITIDTSGNWVVKGPKPLENAILPSHRIIAYYGNLYSKKMGALGEYPKAEMFKKLDAEVKKWTAADPSTPAKPALHLIVVTAQGEPGKAGKYRLRMPFKMIDTTLAMAKEINAEVFLDVQVGLGSLQEEIPALEQYLKLPNVHLGIDPEFAMKKSGKAPGKVIGTFDAEDINYASDYLANLVKTHNLPPKMLIVHRFTRKMVTNSNKIKLRRDVQVVMHMDGWGAPFLKKDTYRDYIYKEPVQYTGFKIFYKNDTKCGKPVMEPQEVLSLHPKPVYIQYQ